MDDNNICKHLSSADDTYYDPALHELLELMQDVGETFNDVSENLNENQYLSNDRENQERKDVSRSDHRLLSLSLDPMLRINIDQLELALYQLGISPSDSDKEKLRSRLKTFSNGDVFYGDFVEAVKDVLLKNSSLYKLPKESSCEQGTRILSDDFDRTKLAVYNAEPMIEEKRDDSNLAIIDELQYLRKQLRLVNIECNFLKKKNYTTEESNKNPKEDSSKKMKKQEPNEINHQQPLVEFNKQLAAISSQLKKTEASKRSYEVAVHKLLKFTEMVHMFTESESKKILNGQTKRLQKKLTKLCNDSQDIIKAVKLILDDEPLPYGWEEVYSRDGHRYYINHMTETTSWVHPVSGIQHT